MLEFRARLHFVLFGVLFSGVAIAAPALPIIRSFTSTAQTSKPGEAVRLSWDATDGAHASLDQHIGDVTGRTGIFVSPPHTTTYTLSVTNAAGSVTRTLTIKVDPIPSSPLGTGSTYYVSPQGNDSNDGRSANSAWRTVEKVNGSSFRPGDNVLFQRNGEWRESLKVPGSGEAGRPITFADYGSGTKPKFLGSMLLLNSEFKLAGKQLFTYALAAPVLAVLVDHTFLWSPTSGAVVPKPNSWAFDGHVLTINSPNSDPRVDRKSYTVVLREDPVYSNYKSYLVFRNLVTDESAAPNGGYGFRIMGSRDVLLEGCEAYRAGKHHFGVINSTHVVGRNLYAAWAMPGLGHGGAIAYVSYGDGTSTLSDQTSEWHNCVWDHPEDPQDADSYYAFYCHGPKLTSVLVDNMTSLGGNFSVGNEEGASTRITIHGGIIQNARVEVYGRNIVFDGMRITGPYATLDMVGSDLLFQNMLIDGTNLGTNWYQSAVVSRGSGNTLRFSTIAVDPKSTSVTTCIAIDHKNSGDKGGAHFSYYGNILSAPKRAVKQWDHNSKASEFSEVEYNLYEAGATFDDSDLDLHRWQASGLDSGSLQGNPRFADREHGDYRLRKGSPAIHAIDRALSGPKWMSGRTDMGALEFNKERSSLAPISLPFAAFCLSAIWVWSRRNRPAQKQITSQTGS